MPTDGPSPEDFLAEADERFASARHSFEGGYFREAVSVGHYAMLAAARGLLAAKRRFPRTHRGVLTGFGLAFVNAGFIDELEFKAFAERKGRREEADYESRRVSEEDVLADAETLHPGSAGYPAEAERDVTYGSVTSPRSSVTAVPPTGTSRRLWKRV